MTDAALQRAVREVVDAAGERRKWNALAPSVSSLERAVAAVFRGQAADVRGVLAAKSSQWPATEAAVPDRFAEFIARVLRGRQRRDALKLVPPLGVAMQAATRVIGKAQWGISFTLEDVGATAYMKAHGAELVAELNKTTVADLRAILSKGIEEGWSYDRVAKAITAKYAAYGALRPQLHIATRAHMIAVTENAFAYGESQLAQARALEGAGLRMLKEWGVSGDERTCEICTGNGGDGPIPLEQSYSSGDMMTPAHPACVVGSTRVFATAVSAATQRLYDGPLVVLTTASGHELACTPNHPILTPQGWVAAGALNEGDDLLCSNRREGMPAGIDHDHDDAPATIEQVAQAFRKALPVTTTEVEVAAEDFHGDGAGSKVAVVWTDGLLRDTRNATLRQHLGKTKLIRAKVGRVTLAALGALATRLDAATAASIRTVCGLRIAPVLLGATSCHLVPVGLCDAASFDASSYQTAGDRQAVHAVRLGERVLGLTGEVACTDLCIGQDGWDGDRRRHTAVLEVLANGVDTQPVAFGDSDTRVPSGVVVEKLLHKVVRERWTGHVFNLQTGNGTYFAEGILTHNCRCFDETYLDPAAAAPSEPPVFNGRPVNLSLLAASAAPLPSDQRSAA